MARRNGVTAAEIPDGSIVCLAQHEIVVPQQRAALQLPGERARRHARGGRRATAPRSATPTRRSHRRSTPTTGAGRRSRSPTRTGIVPAGDVASSLLERDPAAAVRRAARPRSGDRRVRPLVELGARAFGRDGRGQRSRAAAGVSSSVLTSHAKFLMQRRALQRSRRAGRPAHRASRPRARRGARGRAVADAAVPPRLTVVRLAAPGVKPGLATSAWTRHSGIVSIVDIGPTILDQLGLEPPARMEGRPMTFGRTGGDLDDRVDLDGRREPRRAVPRPRDLVRSRCGSSCCRSC